MRKAKFVNLALALVLFGSTVFYVGCEKAMQNETVEFQKVNADTLKINAYVNAIVNTISVYLSSPNKYDESKLEKLLMNEFKKNGIKIIDIEKNSLKESSLSPAVEGYKSLILSSKNFDSKGDYVSHLNMLINTISSDNNLSIEDKQYLVNGAYFMIQLVNSLENLAMSNKEEKDWWDEWGKCAAGIIGEAGFVGIVGFGVGGTIGAVIGVIAGGIKGAADHC